MCGLVGLVGLEPLPEDFLDDALRRLAPRGQEGREAALAMLESGLLAADGVIDVSAVRALVEGGAQRRYNKLWLLLTLEAWYGRWIAGRTETATGGDSPLVPADEWDEEILARRAAAAP